jgi:starch phosphorylase
VRAAWPGVSARRLDAPPARIEFGGSLRVEITVKLNGLSPADVRAELLLSRTLRGAPTIEHSHELTPAGSPEHGEQRYAVDLKPGLAGRLDYRIRLHPKHDLLTHPFELGLCYWV